MRKFTQAMADYGAGISLCLFLACLAFPAFFVRETHDASGGLSLLATGWLGMFAGQFSWLANPVYVAALVTHRAERREALSLAIVALLLALSFLLSRTIVVNEGGFSEAIVGYGWGYFLWVMALLFLVLAQVNAVWRKPPRFVPALQVALIGLAVVAFGVHYYVRDAGHWHLARERSTYMAAHCGEATEKIHDYPKALRRLYLQPDGEEEFSTTNDGKLMRWSSGILFLPRYMADGVTLIGVADPHRPSVPHPRIATIESIGAAVDTLASDYRVETTDRLASQRPGLSITHKHIEVRAMTDNRLVAEATYVVDFSSRQACVPDPSRGFSTRSLLERTFARVGHSTLESAGNVPPK